MGLSKFRKDNDITQEELGEYLGLKKSFISSIERGGRPLPRKHRDALLNNKKGWDTSSLNTKASNVSVAVNHSAANAGNGSISGNIAADYDVVRKEVELLREQNAQLQDTIDYLIRTFDEVRQDYRDILADFKLELQSAKEQYRRASESYIRLVEIRDSRSGSTGAGGNTDVKINM